MLFARHFMFFPPGTCRLHFREAVLSRRYYIYAGGRLCRPPAPPQARTTKNVENGAKQMGEHSTGSQGGFSPLHKITLAKQT